MNYGSFCPETDDSILNQPIIKTQKKNNETEMNVIKSKIRHTRMKYDELVMLSDRAIISKGKKLVFIRTF
jgi:antitoxin component YwqK of YwqJK toxin-antitoxin module